MTFNWDIALTETLSGFCLSHQFLHGLVLVYLFANLKAYIRSNVLFQHIPYPGSRVLLHFHHLKMLDKQLHPDYYNQQCHLDQSSGIELISVGNLFQTLALLHLLDKCLMQSLCTLRLFGLREVWLLSLLLPSREALHTPLGASGVTLHQISGTC